MLDFWNNSELAVSDILWMYFQWAFRLSESENKSKQRKNQETLGSFLLLINFQMDTHYKNLKYPNLKFEIPN